MLFAKSLRGAVSCLAIAAALSAVTAAAPTAAGAETPVKEVKIGVLTDMSSIYSDLVGPGSVLAAQMAIDDFTAAEKPGFKSRWCPPTTPARPTSPPASPGSGSTSRASTC